MYSKILNSELNMLLFGSSTESNRMCSQLFELLAQGSNKAHHIFFDNGPKNRTDTNPVYRSVVISLRGIKG